MSFRSNIDSVWISFTNKSTSLFLTFLTYFIVWVGIDIYQIDPLTFLVTALIFSAASCRLFYVLFYYSLGSGYEDLIEVYKPKWKEKDRKRALINYTLFGIGVFGFFGLYYYLGVVQEIRFVGLGFSFLAFTIWVFYKLYETTSIQKITEIKSSKNFFTALVLTRSQFVLYSKENGILKFDRPTFEYTFLNENELVLTDNGSSTSKTIVVNLTHLPKDNKEELRSHLGVESENIERIYAPIPTKDDGKSTVLLILIFISVLGFACFYWYLENSQIIGVAMIFIMIGIFIVVLFFTLSDPKFSYENHLLRLLMTESKLILYSHGNKMSIFNRLILRYDFIDENELVLLGEELEPQKVITVNLWQLSKNEKQELRSILAQAQKNFGNKPIHKYP